MFKLSENRVVSGFCRILQPICNPMIDSLLSQMYEKLSFNQNHMESIGEGMGGKGLMDKGLVWRLKNVKVVE